MVEDHKFDRRGRRRGVPGDCPASFEARWREGWSQDKLAAHFKTTRHHVRRWMDELSLSGMGRPKRPATRWPPTEQELVELIGTYTLREIGRRYGVRLNTVRYHMQKYDLTVDRPKREKGDGRGVLQAKKPPPREELVKLYRRQRIAAVELAERYKVSGQVIRRWLDDYEIPIYPDNHVNSKSARTYHRRRRSATPLAPAINEAERQLDD